MDSGAIEGALRRKYNRCRCHQGVLQVLFRGLVRVCRAFARLTQSFCKSYAVIAALASGEVTFETFDTSAVGEVEGPEMDSLGTDASTIEGTPCVE